jgi:hypothetical protein
MTVDGKGRRLGVAAFVLVGAGCVALDPFGSFHEVEPTAVEVEIRGEEWEKVFETARAVLAREGPIAAEDPTAGTLETAWDVRVHPFPDEGRRQRFEVSLRRPEGSNAVVVRVAHRLERNANYGDTMDATAAEWKPIPADDLRIRTIGYRIAIRLGAKPPVDPGL